MLYSYTMKTQTFWADWAHFLQRFGLQNPVAAVLEAAGPLTWFFAQVVYLGQPFLDGSRTESQWQALASLLENREESRSFAAFLREEETH
jgi:hypothetical protein